MAYQFLSTYPNKGINTRQRDLVPYQAPAEWRGYRRKLDKEGRGLVRFPWYQRK